MCEHGVCSSLERLGCMGGAMLLPGPKVLPSVLAFSVITLADWQIFLIFTS
jgi:hypothetical protein